MIATLMTRAEKLREALANRAAAKAASRRLWSPFPNSPQEQACRSQADELFFGGAAGGGKTLGMLGLAVTEHRKSLFLRRESVQLTAAVEALKRICGPRGAWRSSGHGGTMRVDGRTVELAGCEHEDDKGKYQGRDHDLKCFDELPHFSRTQYRFIIGWNRTDDPKQRCRVVCGGNPPTTAEGRWVVEEWGPWLDPTHPDPARPGELRWYTYLDNRLTWLRGPDSVFHKGERLTPRSRTFIPAKVTDNPVLMATGYLTVLQSMPEPLRSQMLRGDFTAAMQDDLWQVIPTAWVKAAQARWTPEPPPGQPLTALGADVAHGGAAATVTAPRRGPWFAPLKSYRGAVTDSGRKAAALVLRDHEGDAQVYIDGIGYGAAAAEAAEEVLGPLAISVNVSERTDQYDRSGKYRLANLRTLLYWRLREALDPETGDDLALPPDPELLADLTAPRFEVRSGAIHVEAKEKLKERLGRSPDKGDAVALTMHPPRPIYCRPGDLIDPSIKAMF
jgi:hypothetical protein